MLFPVLDKFESVITRILLAMMAGVVVLATVELGWILGKDVLTPPYSSLKSTSCSSCLGSSS